MQDEVQQAEVPQPETEQQEAQIPAEQAESATGEQAEGEQGKEIEGERQELPRDEKGKFKSPLQERIDQITRQRYEAEREAAYWRERAQAASGQQAQSNSPQGAAQAEPQPDQYADYAQYVSALSAWNADQRVREALAQRDQQEAFAAQQRAEMAKAQAFAARQQEVAAVIPDYAEVVGLSDVQVAPHVQQELLESEKGPQLAYHLAKNPQLADQLNRMPPREMMRAIAYLERDLPDYRAAARPVSSAPKPITPVSGGRTPTSDPNKMTNEQYRAWRASQGARWAK